ncbi:MAG TPA: 3-oxo-5-alpha-steroid 4-dehydrogenase [Bacteroidales bacterium]|nr:3-oxo-5-alpha-steroid 4-dehydrogenase [Bacteroidales bacterium]
MISLENFNTVVLIWIAIALAIFPVQLFITAPYGRHTKRSWGPMINNRLGWIIMELPALIVFVWMIYLGKNPIHTVVLMITSLWLIHYIHRSLIFPFRIKTSNKKMPVLIMLFAVVFNSVNGFINGYWLGNFSSYNLDWLIDIRFISGALLFITGFIINQFHDKILIQLRKNRLNGYQVPHGGLFKYISCPNFFGEIIEWAGFAILVWSLPALAFFVWTFINLVPRAIDHHKWYKNQFDEYPKKRKAVFPFLI